MVGMAGVVVGSCRNRHYWVLLWWWFAGPSSEFLPGLDEVFVPNATLFQSVVIGKVLCPIQPKEDH